MEVSRSIVVSPLSYMISSSCFYGRECQWWCMKLPVGEWDFESLKEDHVFIYASIFCIKHGTCTWSICCIDTLNF